MSKPSESKRIVAAIRANVEAMYAGKVTYEEFHARQRAIWSQVDNRPRLLANVHAQLRA